MQGAFSHDGIYPSVHYHGFMTAGSYVNILKHLVPLDLLGRKKLFHYDNDTNHTARRTQPFLKEQHIKTVGLWEAVSGYTASTYAGCNWSEAD